jgi:hypothetical protein
LSHERANRIVRLLQGLPDSPIIGTLRAGRRLFRARLH